MGRASLLTKTKLLSIAIPLLVVGTGVIGALTSQDAVPKATISTLNSQTTDVKYKGIEGQNALDLLKKYATVQTKHYSFGDLVTAINGTEGNGPKYWSFYLNGKLADIGAGAYTTHTGDIIEWKLQ
ncbi:MAG: DUF4430 domain-containing protein [Patescibacteria group bacterium]